ncbi:MAG: 2-oxoacid:ferredoxin oxidoreductase subunit beta [Candidatus Schekmanbacteria bacterium]|nr:2-oxoacid:ferredoxin oxidoreductase subunit beta [Candidatus Schekmanbacteria bacterium]
MELTRTEVPVPAATAPLTRADFASDQEVRWCPGCDDYAILAQVQKTMPALGIPRENIVIVSGIGCSSRFPYYMATYGFHTIHGRAPAIATGLKIARPELSVWVVTGDGDGLSIGGNHLLHAMRRNVGLKILLFNNRVYGLTKGQFSPTSEVGKKTKSSPMGSIERPVNPVSFALAAEATFVARVAAVDQDLLGKILRRAAVHRGVAFVEILQNCPIFNDGTFDSLTDRRTKTDRTVLLEHGAPLIYGRQRDRGLALDGLDLRVTTATGDGATSRLLVHDEQAPSATLAFLLSRLEDPVAVGVFRAVESPTFEDGVLRQERSAAREGKQADLETLLYRGADTWKVE